MTIASEGWPSHLHHHLQGLTLQVVKDHTQQNSAVLDLDYVLEHGHRAWVQYCSSRFMVVANLVFCCTYHNYQAAGVIGKPLRIWKGALNEVRHE